MPIKIDEKNLKTGVLDLVVALVEIITELKFIIFHIFQAL